VSVRVVAATVPVSREVLADAHGVTQWIERELAEGIEDVISGRPRYGPPAPREPERRCEHCGHLLDDWDDD